MATFEPPEHEDLVTEILAKVKDRRPGAATGPGSDADVQSWSLAHVVHGLHLHLKYGVLYQLIPTRASGWAADAWAWLFGLPDGSGGYGRILARGSTVEAGFTFVADTGPGWVDLDGEIFTDSAGQRYQINESYTPAASGTTSALDVIALDTGSSTNIEVWQGESYTWESTPTQMTDTITQTVDLDGGASAEQNAELRARLAELLQAPPMGGNWPHWRSIAEGASPGNVDAWVWEGQHNDATGYGCTDIACTQRGELGFNGQDKEIESTDALYDTIDAALEIGVMYGALFRMRLLDSNTDVQDIELAITLNSGASDGQRCDFDAETAALTISAYHAGDQSITCSADCTGYISVGDRVILYNAQAVVRSVGIAGGHAADTMFDVDVWFDTYDAEDNPYPWGSGFNPISAAYNICSGGGVIMDCMRAIMGDVFEPLGPYKGSADVAAPIPGWDDTLRLQAIQSALIVAGDAAGEGVVVDVDITTPAVDTEPQTGNDTDVYFMAPGEITIWESK